MESKTKILKRKVALMCPNCYDVDNTIVLQSKISTEIFNNNSANCLDLNYGDGDYFDMNMIISGYCDKCDQYVRFIQLDKNIKDIISLLNKKGYRTLFSCEGHFYGYAISQPYVAFEQKLPKGALDSLPITWKVYENSLLDYGDSCIIRPFIGDSEYEPTSYKRFLSDLEKWVDDLDYIV